MVHIGVIGAGAWGLNLIRNVVASRTAKLVAVLDIKEEARRTVASRYRDVRTMAHREEFFATPDMDAVIVASPPSVHYEHAIDALEAGYHLLVEKPLCMNSAEALDLVNRASAAKRTLMVGHTFRYNNLVEEIKHRIDDGELGDVCYLYGQRLNLGTVRTDVDALWNLAPHDISIANYLCNDRPITVSARGSSYVQVDRNVADVAFFQMDYVGGKIFSGHVSWLDPQKTRRMVVVGTKRMLVYDDMNPAEHIQIYDKRVERDFQAPQEDFADFKSRVKAGDLVIPSIRLEEPLRAEIEHFAACVRDGVRPRTTGEDGVELVCILEAMTASMAQQGRSVPVKYLTDRVHGELTVASAISDRPTQHAM